MEQALSLECLLDFCREKLLVLFKASLNKAYFGPRWSLHQIVSEKSPSPH